MALLGSDLLPQARPAGEEFDSERAAGSRRLVPTARAARCGPTVTSPKYCARLEPFTHAVTRAVRAGAVLWIDYGLPRRQYYLPERRSGTFLCHLRQRAHDDALLCPGLQDMTSWVDYTLLAECGRSAGFSIEGFRDARLPPGCARDRRGNGYHGLPDERESSPGSEPRRAG